jgi:hypothetical protein
MVADAETFGDPTTAEFWAAARRHALVIQRCGGCGSHQFYPRPFCLSCGSGVLTWVRAVGTATVYSMTEIHMAPSPEFEIPYVVAIVELDEGPKMMTNLINGRCRIGDRVRLAWRAREGKPPLPVFEPVAGGA